MGSCFAEVGRLRCQHNCVGMINFSEQFSLQVRLCYSVVLYTIQYPGTECKPCSETNWSNPFKEIDVGTSSWENNVDA